MSDSQLPSSELMEALMKDPVKKQLLLQLLVENKDGFEAYKRREEKLKKTPTSHKKLDRLHCESPTALQRRRALEKLNQNNNTTSDSEQSSVESEGPKLPFEELLRGVTAYVEVKRNNVDRSEGIKTVMRLMGATVMDQFTSKVTHVVFKDGSFTTYQKAKLMKVHLVSVLWLDAVRRTSTRVSEKKYPAFGSSACDENVSILCSQLQKDYEEVVKDEKKRKSLHNLSTAKLNTTKKRHTIMISQTSTKNQQLFAKSDEDMLTSDDDSDCGVINGRLSKRSEEKVVEIQDSFSITDDLSNDSLLKENSSDSKSLLTGVKSKSKRQTINVLTDMIITPNIELTKSDEKTTKQLKESQSFVHSARTSSGSDRTKSGLDKALEETKLSSSVSNLENPSKSSTTMSSLRLSDSLKKTKTQKREQSKNTNQSGSLHRSISNLSERSKRSVPEDEKSADSDPRFKKRETVITSTDNAENDNTKPIQKINKVTIRKPRQRRATETDESSEEEVNSNNQNKKDSPAKRLRVEKKTRKLYNPNDGLTLFSPAQSDAEREELRQKKSKKNLNSFASPKITTHEDLLVLSTEKADSLSKAPNTKKKTDKKKNEPRQTDTQKELLALLTEKIDKDGETRRSQRLSLSQTKPKYTFTSSSSSSQSNLIVTPLKRRSTLDFQTITPSQQKRKSPKRSTSIVCTKMHRPESLNFQRIVKQLGTFFVEDQVTDRTTHLVAGEAKRTINMLRALARGCWIVKHEWLLKSEQEGKWLEEEDYEVTDFSPAVQQCRLQRQAFGADYRMDVFKDCGFIYVGKSTTPKQQDLQELITTCQGKITTIYRNASIAVGQLIKGENIASVKETWVLDSITFNKLKPFKKYFINKPDGADSPHF